MVKREPNKEIAENRNELRRRYGSWKSITKLGRETLPRNYNQDNLNKIRKSIENEIERLGDIIACSESLMSRLRDETKNAWEGEK